MFFGKGVRGSAPDDPLGDEAKISDHLVAQLLLSGSSNGELEEAYKIVV